MTSAAVLPCVLQVLRRGAPCCAEPGCACAAQLRRAAGAAAAADTDKWSLEAMGFGPIQLFDFLYSQLQTSNLYNQKIGKPRFGGDGLKMAKCLLRDGTIYTKLHALLALHGGASAPPPISTVDAQRVRTKPGPKPGPKPKRLQQEGQVGAALAGEALAEALAEAQRVQNEWDPLDSSCSWAVQLATSYRLTAACGFTN